MTCKEFWAIFNRATDPHISRTERIAMTDHALICESCYRKLAAQDEARRSVLSDIQRTAEDLEARQIAEEDLRAKINDPELQGGEDGKKKG